MIRLVAILFAQPIPLAGLEIARPTFQPHQAGYELAHSTQYSEIANDFRGTFPVLKALPRDNWLESQDFECPLHRQNAVPSAREKR